MRFNPFKFLPLLLAAQIVAGLTMGGQPSAYFPESDASLELEVAETPLERKRGLMYRERLPVDQGMLFVFPEEDERGFWMKNTLIPLDMIFIDRDGKIINIEEAQPEPNTPDRELKTYRSEGEAQYVIEANSTFTEEYGVKEGDRVEIPRRVR